MYRGNALLALATSNNLRRELQDCRAEETVLRHGVIKILPDILAGNPEQLTYDRRLQLHCRLGSQSMFLTCPAGWRDGRFTGRHWENLMMYRSAACIVFGLALTLPCLPGQTSYQKPPKAVLDVLNAPAPPDPSISPAGDWILLVDFVRYPPIADLAEPMLRLAGERINPKTNGLHRRRDISGLTLLKVADGSTRTIALRPAARFGLASWSADGRHIALTNTAPSGIELWILETANASLRRLPGIALNAAYGDAVQWMPDQKTLLVRAIPAGRGKPPAEPSVPKGPSIQENLGGKAPVWTFQDLLRNAHDEDLFDYYLTSQLLLVDAASGKWSPVGKPAIFDTAEPSPDGKSVLIAKIHRPYSYMVTASSFPKDVEVCDLSGAVIQKLASLPLQEQVPMDGVPVGPRSYRWRAGEPATLTWAEALDEGNPKAKVPHRDRILQLRAPFREQPQEIARTEFRRADLSWLEKGGMALLREFDRPTRRTRTWLIDANNLSRAPRKIWDRNSQDRYGDPGDPLTRIRPDGSRVVRQTGDVIFLEGYGASPEGSRPFLDEFNLQTLQSKRIYRCAEKTYETILDVLAEDGSRFLTRFESPSEPANLFVRSRDGSENRVLTHFKDPTPQLRRIRKELVAYKRADGVQLSFTLYLPPDYKAGERLPTVVWAYPMEFTDRDTAGQVSTSPYRFTAISGPSHLFCLLQGYAVLDNASMPVIGDAETVNNTYIEQIIESARAAIDRVAEMGVADRERIGVGGHSYGAFMTANLLSHCNLFKAGVARSGAYNRTLTPFGFQAERRTLWEAPETYIRMSPFMFAHKINTPILLIHGEADNNSGTFPVQSERYYHALKGQGKTVRYVTLPFESHGYAARESVEHTLYEMIRWFDLHLKR